MRLLGVLALVAPVAIGTLLFVVPEFLVSWIDDGFRSILAALGAGAIGVSLTAMLVALYLGASCCCSGSSSCSPASGPRSPS